MLKLAALGALGYFGYRYYRKNQGGSSSLRTTGTSTGDTTTGTGGRQGSTGTEPNVSDPQVALAGGPLSNDAAIVHSGQPYPQG